MGGCHKLFSFLQICFKQNSTVSQINEGKLLAGCWERGDVCVSAGRDDDTAETCHNNFPPSEWSEELLLMTRKPLPAANIPEKTVRVHNHLLSERKSTQTDRSWDVNLARGEHVNIQFLPDNNIHVEPTVLHQRVIYLCDHVYSTLMQNDSVLLV